MLEVLARAHVEVSGTPELLLDAPAPPPDEGSPLAGSTLDWDAAAERAEGGGSRRDGGGSRPARASVRRPRRYLAVGTADAVRAAEPLLAQRRAQGALEVRTAVLGVDIPLTADAPLEIRRQEIKRYLDLGSRSPRDRPKYVLLLGDGDEIPFFHAPSYREKVEGTDGIPVLSDQWYAQFAEGELPRFALGRLPFGPDGIARYCAAFFSGPAAWTHWLLLSGDGTWYGEHISKLINDFGAQLPLLRSRIFPSPPPPETSDFEGKLRVHLDVPPTLTSYRGHGRRGAWIMQQEIGAPFVRSLGTGRREGVLSIACCTATLDHPVLSKSAPGCGSCSAIDACTIEDPLGRSWLLEGKAAWFIGSSRKSFTAGNDLFHRRLVQAFAENDPRIPDVGSAFRVALKVLVDEPEASAQDNVAMAILLGDPAWPLPSYEAPPQPAGGPITQVVA